MRWTSDGYAGAWKFEEGRLVVELWRIQIDRDKPKDFPEADNSWFRLSR